MHLAAAAADDSVSPSSDVMVRALIDAWPAGAHQLDECSHTPLHHGVIYGNSGSIVQALVEAWPEVRPAPQWEAGTLPREQAVLKRLMHLSRPSICMRGDTADSLYTTRHFEASKLLSKRF